MPSRVVTSSSASGAVNKYRIHTSSGRTIRSAGRTRSSHKLNSCSNIPVGPKLPAPSPSPCRTTHIESTLIFTGLTGVIMKSDSVSPRLLTRVYTPKASCESSTQSPQNRVSLGYQSKLAPGLVCLITVLAITAPMTTIITRSTPKPRFDLPTRSAGSFAGKSSGASSSSIFLAPHLG